MTLRLGIDVGGTNTDAVVLDERNRLLAKGKTPTTEDVTSGIQNALQLVLEALDAPAGQIGYAMLGTTHCTNAIAERKGLARIGIIRIAKPATLAIEPLMGWPPELVGRIGGRSFIVQGGHEYDGRELMPLGEDEVRQAAKSLREDGVPSIAISGTFSPVNAAHEDRAAEIVREVYPDAFLTLSHQIGSIGLLERENAAVLNAAVIAVARRAVRGFEAALRAQDVRARLFLTQNDGTLMSAEYALNYPVLTIASGPTNSLRGAAFLSERKDAIVVDVGGTTTDVGILVSGFPRQSGVSVEIGGVKTNFRMPDLVSIGLGGGSLIRQKDGRVVVGPESVGYRITKEAMIFGGNTLTMTDVCVGLGQYALGNGDAVRGLERSVLEDASRRATEMAEETIDRLKTSAEPIPVILVGGGSIILPNSLRGASDVFRPENFDVANAIGAAIAQVGGEVDRIFSLEKLTRDEALAQARDLVRNEAIRAGADPTTVELVELEEIPLAYLPGNAVRTRAKAVGNLAL
jgi:N-methylhydantoinase A/oxoprolinase/acetone carboxylase beta subunit